MATTAEKRPKEPKHAASFISELVSDPNEVPDVLRMSGYLGASPEEGYVRLYLTPDLTYSVNIKSEDILLEQPVPQTTDPLGAVNLWIKRNAEIKPTASKGATQVSQTTLPTGQGAAPQGTFTPVNCTVYPVCYAGQEGGGGQAAQGTFTPIPCGGGGGGFTFTPVTLPHSITPLCPPPITRPPICPQLTWPTIQTIHTLPTIPTFPTQPTIHTFPTTPVAGGGVHAAAPQGTFTPVNCTVYPVCFAGQEGGGGQMAQGTFTPIPCGGGGGGGGGFTFTPVTLPHTFTPICITQPPICPQHTITPICQIVTHAPICPPLTWPTIPHTLPTLPTIHTFPTTPVGAGGGGQMAAPQGTFTPVNCTVFPVC